MKFFNSKKKLNQGGIYAVHKGTYLGFLLFLVEYIKETDSYGFISINNLKNLIIPSKDVEEGIKNNLLRKTTINLPQNFRKICVEQYRFNIDNPNITDIIKKDENIDLGL